MAQQEQTYATHTRRPPALYLVGATVLVLDALYAVWVLIQNPGGATLRQLFVAVALVLVALAIRGHSMRVQDRVIRLEERLRLFRILPEDLRGRVDDLTPSQLIALRFASDDELADLVRRTLAGEFQKSVDIKREVKNWRGDYLRA